MSSSGSQKARETQHYIHRQNLPVDFLCPELSNYPDEAALQLYELIPQNQKRKVGLIGSSLGGFYATWLSQSCGVPAVLVNPAINPHELIRDYLGLNTNPYTQQDFELQEKHLQMLRELDIDPIAQPELLFLMVQEGDETLNFRQALDKYSTSRQIVEPGGDHRFQNYDRHLPDIFEFLQLP